VIIWGSCGKEKEVGRGLFCCPNCRTQQHQRTVRVARYFTLYFLPLFETSVLGEYVQCLRCGGQFDLAALHYNPQAEVDRNANVVRQAMQSGMAVQALRQQLARAGVEPASVEQLIAHGAGGGGFRTCPRCQLSYFQTVGTCGACGDALPA
jgi:hypothetical protein